jgi:transcriptional regulator with XRE-family HTH domain
MEKINITPNQCKAARDLLGWKQVDLAQKSNMGITTIAEFERGIRDLANRTMIELGRTFEDAGIEFLNNEKGEGLILLKKKKK